MLYKEAAEILTKASSGDGTVKKLVLSSNYENKKLLMALVAQTAKYQSILRDILKATKLSQKSHSLRDPWLAAVLVYDLLLGKGLHGAGKLKRVLEKHRTHLQAELTRLKVRAGVTDASALLTGESKHADNLPRFVRVNTLKTTVKEVIAHFRHEDYRQVPTARGSYDSFLSVVQGLKVKQFTQDIHIPELLVFASGTDLHNHTLYSTGDIILQDKASCLPAYVLAPPAGSVVMDCCAAPGNKTSHAAAIMQNKGKIFAIDKDGQRLSTMNTLLLRAGALCTQLIHADFLSLQPHDPRFSQVEYAIVDPSCSGSGIVGRLDVTTGEKKEDAADASRLQKLANFQAHVVKHALCFPAIKRLVYSTCSVHREENEEVVKRVLQDFGDYVSLVPALPQLPSRGYPEFEGGDSCLRLSSTKDLTNGFFVACFERKPDTIIDQDVIRSVKGSFTKSDEKKQMKRKFQNDNNTDSASIKKAKKDRGHNTSYDVRDISGKDSEETVILAKTGKHLKPKKVKNINLDAEKSKPKKPAKVRVISQPGHSKNKKNKKGKRKHTPVTLQ